MTKKKIYLLTKNFYKFREFQQFFDNYNVAVKMVNDFTAFKNAEELLNRYWHLLEEPSTLTVLCDETQLFRKKDDTRIIGLTAADDLALVYTKTILYYLEKEELATFSSTFYQGVINFSYRKTSQKVFGWDDVFILKSTGLSYQELKNRKMKNHCRQDVLSQFAMKYLHYSKKIDLKFNQINQTGVIEFSNKIFDLVNSNQYINAPAVQKAKLNNLFQYALNNGGFFRSAKNRRQRNYWIPGLNAGIPLVPKKDEIHEITFFVHDLGHFVLPDLIYSGENKALHDRVYIIYRMMSEALTLVVADMLFVDGLMEEGIEYDFSKRKIYPLYQAIKKRNPEVSMKVLMFANVQYCLLGEDAGFVNLMDTEDLEALYDFKQKYEPFFIEDFKWTQRNLDNMKSNTNYFSDWYQENESIFQAQNLESIETYTSQKLNLKADARVGKRELVQLIFNQVFDHYFNVLNTGTTYSIEERISNSFKKYMLGQLMIFYRIDFLPYGQFLKNTIREKLCQKHLNLKEIVKICALYNDFLNVLESEYHLINKDDLATFKEVYPIFDSFFVFYDREKNAIKTLKEASEKALKF